MTNCPWDLNGDGVVDDADLDILRTAFGSKPGDANWNPACDFNDDGVVSVLDAIILEQNRGPCPGVTPPPTGISCNGATPHYPSGCALLLHYGAIGGGVYEDVDHSIISRDELYTASQDQRGGLLTAEEYDFVVAAEAAGSINALCTGCYSVTPPAMETKTMALTEGQHTIQVSLSGYSTLQATINVSPTGVSCVSVVGGACGGTGLPRVSTSAFTVTTYLKTAPTVSDVCTWINSIGGWRSLQWTSHVLEAYYTYIGASGHSVGFSPVTWDDVLGLYYYYINDPTAGNGKIGCGT